MNLSTLASALAIPAAVLSLAAGLSPANFGSNPAQPTVLAQTTSAEASHFTLTNESSKPLVKFHIEAVNESIGAENLLDQPLQPGESRRITITTGTICVSTVTAVFADGTSREHENVDVCELGGYTYDD